MDLHTVRIVATALAGTPLDVRSIRRTEDPNRLYRFDLGLTLGDPTSLHGRERSLWDSPVTLVFEDASTGAIRAHGLITELSYAPHAHACGFTLHLIVRPRVWIMTRTYRSRKYLGLTVRRILTQKLEDAGFKEGVDFLFAFRAEHLPRGCLVQHRQSDFDFMVQLCEQRGIFLSFEQGSEREILIISDAESALPSWPLG